MNQENKIHNLELYYFDECPFCQKVLTYIKENHLKLTFKNIHTTPQFKKELIAIGGKSQVPCLIIDGKALYESSEIIKWLEKNR